MPPTGFEPAIPASERPQAYVLDRLHDMYSPESNGVLKSRKITKRSYTLGRRETGIGF